MRGHDLSRHHSVWRSAALAALVSAGPLLLAGCERTQSAQQGPSGHSQIQLKKPSAVAAPADVNRIPPPEDPADADSPPATEVFVDVQVLKDVRNTPSAHAGNTALPGDPLSRYLMTSANDVRIQATKAPPPEGRRGGGVKQAESTDALVMYRSGSLGVNCTYCHNTRALAQRKESRPQRATAWHGIRMTRMLNPEYLEPVGKLLPAHRMSAEGDFPKVGCATCHKGRFKPLNGVSPLPDYLLLAGEGKVPADTPTPPEPAASAATPKVVSQAESPVRR